MILTTVPWSNSSEPTILFLSNNWKDWKASNDWQPTKIKQRENYLWINLQLKLPVHFRPLSVHGQVNYDWNTPVLISNFPRERWNFQKKKQNPTYRSLTVTVYRVWKLHKALYVSTWLQFFPFSIWIMIRLKKIYDWNMVNKYKQEYDVA